MPNDYGSGEKLLTKGEVAQLCRVEVRTIDRWLMAGKIKCYRTPSGRVLFRRNDVLSAIEQKPVAGRSGDRAPPDPAAGEGPAHDAHEGRP
jgi:excisionase family DNA binding protein